MQKVTLQLINNAKTGSRNLLLQSNDQSCAVIEWSKNQPLKKYHGQEKDLEQGKRDLEQGSFQNKIIY